MGDLLTFTVPGEPVPKGRPRHAAYATAAGKLKTRTYTPAQTAAYEEHVKLCCQIAANQQRWLASKDDRFELSMRVFREHEGAGGDIDNYFKAIADGINKVAYPDDRYIRHTDASLFVDAARPRVDVRVRRMRVGEALAYRRDAAWR